MEIRAAGVSWGSKVTVSPCRTVLIIGGLCSDGDFIDFSLMPSLTLYRSECYFCVIFSNF